MKLLLLSDTHIGFGRGTERRNDATIAFQEIMERACEMNVDAVLFAGDMFNTSMPSSENMIATMKGISNLFVLDGAKIVEFINKDPVHVRGAPFIAIHGNHERRSKGFRNPVESMEDVGFLIHLHLNGIVIEKGGERVAVQGMSFVPERYAKSVLEKWSPKPVEGARNILLLHQSIDKFVYSPLEPPTINISDLPKGFDLILDGHIHKREEVGGTNLVICGSTIATQTKLEGDKGFYILDTKTMKMTFYHIKNQRKIFIYDVETSSDVVKILDELSKSEYKMKPIVRLKLHKKMNEHEVDKYRNRFIISFSLALKSEGATESEDINDMNIEDLGRELLKKNAKEIDTNFLFNNILDENAFDIIYKKIGEEIDKEN